jgi:hypothetical protein
LVGAPQHHCEQIVEIVRNAARQLSDGIETLGATQLLLQQPAHREIACNRQVLDAARRRHRRRHELHAGRSAFHACHDTLHAPVAAFANFFVKAAKGRPVLVG